MGFDVIDIRGREAGRLERGTDHHFLGRTIGRGEPTAATVLVDGGSAHDGEDPVAVTSRVGEPFEDDYPAAFAPDVPVRGGVERRATPVGREHPRRAEVDGGFGREHDVHAARQRQVGFARSERVRREVNGDERRRTRGVDREGGTVESQEIGDAAGGDAPGRAGARVCVEPFALRHDQPVVIGGRDSEEHTGTAPHEATRRDPGVLERFPRDFEHESLLRVHHLGLERRDPEELGVEAVDLPEEPSMLDVIAVGPFPGGVEAGAMIPAVAGDRPDRVPPFAQQRPERLRVVGAGEAKPHAHDRDRLRARGALPGQLVLQPPNLYQCLLHR